MGRLAKSCHWRHIGQVHISQQFFRRSPMPLKNGRCLRRRRSRLASTMQFAICLYEDASFINGAELSVDGGVAQV